MSVTPTARRWPLFLSIPAFGLFSFCAVFLFSFVYLMVLFPDSWQDASPRMAGELSGPQAVSLFSFSAGEAAALSGMLFWGLLMVRPWRWLQTQHWSMTALFGGLISLIQIISTSCLMWVFYCLFLVFVTPFSSDTIKLLIMLPLGSIGLAIFTLVIVAVTSKGLVFLGGIVAGMGFALLARRIFG